MGQLAARARAGLPIVAWFAGPVLLRLVAMQFNHHWDVQTWYANFADIKFDHSPYDTMRTLSFETRVERSGLYYEYHAYPPGLIYLYWPIAKLYALFDTNLAYHFGRQGLPPVVAVPWYFNYFFKVPLMLADIGIAALLWKMGGKDVARRYVWSLYPVMVLTWQFDTLVTFCILWSVYALQRKRLEQAALALALGTVIKYVPLFIVPAIILYLVRQGYSFGRILRFGLVFGGVSLVLILPNLDGTLFSLEFQASRIGGGLSWHSLFVFLNQTTATLTDMEAASLSAAIGGLMLPLGLLVVYAYTYRRNLSLISTVLVTLLGYLAFTKIVNEVYLLNVIPLLLLELKAHPDRIKEWYYRMCWAVPIAVAIIRAPLPYFLNTSLASLDDLDPAGLTDLNYLQDSRLLALLMFVIGTLFTIMLLMAIPRFAVSEKRRRKPCLSLAQSGLLELSLNQKKLPVTGQEKLLPVHQLPGNMKSRRAFGEQDR